MALPTLSFYSKSPCPIFFPLIKHTLALRRPLPNRCRAAAADGGAPLQSTASTSNLSSIFCSLSLPTLSPEMKKPIKDNSGGIEDLTLFSDEETSEISSTDKPIFRVTLAELMLQSRIKPSSVYGDLNVPISGIQDDSREVVAGDLFICRVGSRKDGHEYLEEAISKGAVAIVADRELKSDEVFGCRAAVIVEDTQSAIPLLAASFYRRPSEKLSVIGVTGTNGKTTTTHLIKSVYEAMGWRTGMLGTVGYFVHGHHQLEAANTTPDALVLQKLMSEMVENGSKAVVMEASSHGLALGRCNEIDFDVAVFTNLTRDHLDFHGTTEEYRKSKGKLFDKMLDRKKHRKVVNLDDPNAFYFIDQGNPDVPVVTYAMENKDADVRPLDFQLSLFKTRILVGTPKGSMEIFSKLIGRHNIYNILATVAVGIAMDLPVDAIVRGIGEMDGVPGRCELIDEMQEFAVIVDYAHSPDALSRLLDAVRELSPKRVITALRPSLTIMLKITSLSYFGLVFGCGGERDRGKRPLMTKVAAEKSDLTILTSDNPRNEDPMEILDDMLAGVGWTVNDYLRFGESDCYPPLPNNHRIFVHENRRVAVRAAVAMGREGDMVVIAGKGHEAYQIEGNKKKFFDDRIECREGLQVVKNLQQEGIDTRAFPWWLPHRY